MRWLPALAAVLLASCYPTLDWREVTSAEGKFSVLLPRKPARDVRAVAFAGYSVRMEMYAAQVSGMAFGVGYADLPSGADPDRMVRAGCDALVRNIAGTITNERAITINGAHGI